MKKINAGTGRVAQVCGILLISFLFVSCDFYNFSEPQPYDREKVFHFPDALLGTWKKKDQPVNGLESAVPQNGKAMYDFATGNEPGNGPATGQVNEDRDIYCIYRDYMIIVHSEKKKIVAGAWPKPDVNNTFIYPPEGFAWQYEIKYDSLNRSVDTVDKYIISGKRVYEKDDDRFLRSGYVYSRVKDTITVYETDSVFIDLGQNAFLRRLTDSIYVFNINNSILSMEEAGGWWRVIVLELNGNGIFSQWECSNKTGNLPCMFYDRPSKYDQFYFDCSWSTTEMLKLMKEGYFERKDIMQRMGK